MGFNTKTSFTPGIKSNLFLKIYLVFISLDSEKKKRMIPIRYLHEYQSAYSEFNSTLNLVFFGFGLHIHTQLKLGITNSFKYYNIFGAGYIWMH